MSQGHRCVFFVGPMQIEASAPLPSWQAGFPFPILLSALGDAGWEGEDMAWFVTDKVAFGNQTWLEIPTLNRGFSYELPLILDYDPVHFSIDSMIPARNS